MTWNALTNKFENTGCRLLKFVLLPQFVLLVCLLDSVVLKGNGNMSRLPCVRAVARSTGLGAESVVGQSGHGVWENHCVSKMDTVGEIELTPLTESLKQGLLLLELRAKQPRVSFPTTCIVSVRETGSPGRSRDDVVVKEWILNDKSRRGGPSAPITNPFEATIPIRTLENVVKVTDKQAPRREQGTLWLTLTLRFVGCCDRSDRHEIAVVGLYVIPTVGGNEGVPRPSVSASDHRAAHVQSVVLSPPTPTVAPQHDESINVDVQLVEVSPPTRPPSV